MFKNILLKNWPLFALNAIVILFFLRLFFPLSTYTTPDIGRSDLLHMSLPAMLVESNILRKIACCLGGFAFVFSAAMILRIPQLAVAQAISVVPLALAFFIIFLEK